MSACLFARVCGHFARAKQARSLPPSLSRRSGCRGGVSSLPAFYLLSLSLHQARDCRKHDDETRSEEANEPDTKPGRTLRRQGKALDAGLHPQPPRIMSPPPSTSPVKVPASAATYTPATLDPDLRSQINAALLREGHVER